MTPLFAKQTSDRAFERLYQAHVQDVYRYSLMVLRNRDDAEDVAQTTFMKAYRAIRRGEEPRSPRSWLIAIAHNTCRTRMRDAKRRPQEVAFEEQIAEAASVDGDQEQEVGVKELLHALGALSFNQRAALVMRELEGRSYAEIAQVLELTPSAVETLLFRARRAMREQLEGSLTCGEAELALSRDLDGRLAKAEKSQLRAHLRECRECAGLARRQRARRAALRGLGPLPLPASLAGWGGGTAVGVGVATKVAAVLAAGVAAAGVAHDSAEAIDRSGAQDRAPVATVARSDSVRTGRRTEALVRSERAADARPGKAAARRADGSTTAPGAPGPAPAGEPPADDARQPDPSGLPIDVPKLPVEPPAAPLPSPPELPSPPATPPLPEPPALPPLPELPPVQPPQLPTTPEVPSLP